MNEPEFQSRFAELTPQQHKVLRGFLAGRSDEAIAQSLYLEASTVRRHLSNICKRFALTNSEDECYSHRDELIDLMGQFQPELVSPTLLDQGRSPQPRFPGPPLSRHSPFYIKRQTIEQRCSREVLKPGALVRIRAPRQTGKTSLIHQTIAAAQTSGLTPLYLNLRQLETLFLSDLDALLRWFCTAISQHLNVAPQLDNYWDRDQFGSIVSCTAYMQGCILPHQLGGLLLVLDEVDWLFERPAIAQGWRC